MFNKQSPQATLPLFTVSAERARDIWPLLEEQPCGIEQRLCQCPPSEDFYRMLRLQEAFVVARQVLALPQFYLGEIDESHQT